MFSTIKAYAFWLTLSLATLSFSTGLCSESGSQFELSPPDKTEIFWSVAGGHVTPHHLLGDLSREGVEPPLRFHGPAQVVCSTSSGVPECFGGLKTIGGDNPMTIYYVAKNGSGNASGSATEPFNSIQQALNAGLQPGDEVVVRAGTYQEALEINTGGSAAGNVTLRAEVPGTVTLDPLSNSFNAISINDDFVTVSGLRIVDAVGDGIEANGVHHIEILNNVISGSGESGIQFNYSDFILVDGNITYENASDGWFSGISIYQNRNITGDSSRDEFRTVISNNITYDNVTYTGDHTDGNGIIIDDFQSTQTGGFPEYNFPTLVENNLAYGNGGKGIQVVWSDGVTVRNNTAFHNNNDDLNVGTWRGEISNSQSSNNTFINNIAVADPDINSGNTAIDSTSYGGYTNDNVVWISNLTFNGQAGSASIRTDGNNPSPSTADGNLLGVDPGFVNAPNDFRLSDNSVAIDAGSNDYGLPGADLDGLARAVGIVDIGAYESGSSPVPPTTPTDPVAPSGPTNTAPQAVDDNGFETEFETPISLNIQELLANDTDADGDALSITSVQNANGASVSLNGTTILLTPDDGFSGEAGFDKTVSDGNGGFSTSRASVTVGGQEAQPGVPNPPVPPVDQEPIDGFSIWSDADPETPVFRDPDPVTLGLEFTADVDATLNGLRLYLTDANSERDSIDLWSADGELLAHANIEPSGTAGWQTITFDEPVQLNAGEAYVASYFTTGGSYAVSKGFFNGSEDKGPVSIGSDAGVFSYGSEAGFPAQSYEASNYWVDLVLDSGPSGASGAGTTPATDAFIGEAGVVTDSQDDSDNWTSVTFENALDNPTVVMGGLTGNGGQPYNVRVRDVTSEGFEYQIDEWDYLDGRHTAETISWLAIESGTHVLEDGRTITAGSTSVGGRWEDISFENGIFDEAPVVFGQSSGDGNVGAVVDRIRDVTAEGFETRLYAEEASSAKIVSDAFNWIAIENGGSASAGSLAGTTGERVNHEGFELDFEGSFAFEDFVFLTDMQTTRGSDPSTLRTTSIDNDMVGLAVLEERSADREQTHVLEDAGYAGFQAAPILGVSLIADDTVF